MEGREGGRRDVIEPRWPDERELAASSLPSFGGLSQSGCWAAAGLHVPSPSTEWAVCGGRCRRSLSPLYTRFHQFHYRPLLHNKPDLTVCASLQTDVSVRLSLSLFPLCQCCALPDRQTVWCVCEQLAKSKLVDFFLFLLKNFETSIAVNCQN